MIRCNECEEWFSIPELKQPINPRTGKVRWDEDYAEVCPECSFPLDGEELTGEPCEKCPDSNAATGDDGLCDDCREDTDD